MNGKASFLCRLELQLRYRLPATLRHPRAVTFTEDQDVVVAGLHIPLAGLHQWIWRSAVAVAIGMVLAGDQLLSFLPLFLQSQVGAGDVEPTG
jgi:hypothetical protein